MADLGKAYVQIMPSAKGISGSITRAIQPEAASAGKAAGSSLFGGMMKVAGGIGITKALSWATGKLTENLSGAVSRYDAINNSKNVFKAMKFSTEEANQVTEYFSETLDGLPTGFDEAIKGTQSFAGATKDLKWSGETWNALNNAVLAFGGSSEQTSRVTDMLTKSFSSGTIDGQAFRSMLANGLGPALQEMATRAGYNNLDELQEAFKNGELSAADFGEMLQDVSENGSADLESLEDMARANVMGIGTAFGLIGSRIVQGLAGILESVETTLEKIGLPSIAEMIDVFSKGIRESIKKIGTGIEVLGDFIIEHKELFIGAWEIMGGVIEFFKDLFTGNLTEMGTSFSEIFDGFILKIEEILPTLIEKGLQIVSNLIEGITSKYPEWYAKGWELMVEFAGILAESIPKLLRLGADFVISLLKGITNKLPEWISKATEMVVTMAGTLGDNLPQLIQKGAELLAGVARGFRDKFPEIVRAAAQMIVTLLGEIARSLPQLIVAGIELIVKLAAGIVQAIPQVLTAMGNVARGIRTSVSNISLWDAGRAIISGFVRGLKSAWGAGKTFIGGIGGWIKNNKGPLSYDRKLLRPAGDAIMQGLDKGLQERFKGVKDTVGGMAGVISDTMTARPTIDVDSSVARSNALLDGTINHQLKDLKLNSKPAYINLNIGGQVFRAFVEDISNEQGKITDLEMQF